MANSANINVESLTMNPEEVRSVSEIVFEKAFTNPDLGVMHAVKSGIKMKEQILLFGKMAMQGKASTGCDPVEAAAGIVASEKFWEPKEIAIKLKHCKKDLPALFKAFEAKAKDSYDETSSKELAFLADQLLEAVMDAVYRLVWFGDTEAAAYDAGTGLGTLTPGTDVSYFTPVDGLWKQIFTAEAAGKIKKVEIAANAGADYVAQELPAGEGLKVLRALYNGADSRLKRDAQAHFIVTQSLYDNFQDQLEDAGLSALGALAVNDGVLTYRGKKIVVADFMDRMIAGYEDNGAKFNLPHRAIFSTSENLPIGTVDEGSFSEVSSWYNRDDRNNYLENIFSIDAKVIEEYMIAVAY